MDGQVLLLARLSEHSVTVLRRTDMVHHLAKCLRLLGWARDEIGQYDAAREALEEAVEIYRHLAQSDAATTGQDLARALKYLGRPLASLGHREKARTVLEEAVEIYRQLTEANPKAIESALAGALNDLGTVLRDCFGNWAEAAKVFEEVQEIYRRLSRSDRAAFEVCVARTLCNMGVALSDSPDPLRARPRFEEALAIYRQLVQTDPAAFESELATILHDFGCYLWKRLRDRGGARAMWEEALVIRRRLAEIYPLVFEPHLAGTLCNLGGVLQVQGNAIGARERYAEALQLLWPHYLRRPGALRDWFVPLLRNYVSITPRDDQDPWWQLWDKGQLTTEPPSPKSMKWLNWGRRHRARDKWQPTTRPQSPPNGLPPQDSP
jgi:tetratricopeptide (TPR) repeat protein